MLKCINQCLKGYVFFLAACGCAKGWGDRPHTDWQKVYGQSLDESPITITPFQLAMINMDKSYWEETKQTPAVSCDLTTEYEAKGGADATISGTLGYTNDVYITSKSPFHFFVRPRNMTAEDRMLPRIELYNAACSEVVDGDYCETELRHNRPAITMKCHIE